MGTKCSSSFATKWHLQRHLRVHAELKKKSSLKCESGLNKHAVLQRKGRLKPYLCRKCHKRFSSEAHLKEHMQTHLKREDRTKYYCKQCPDVSFTLKSSQTRHMKRFH